MQKITQFMIIDSHKDTVLSDLVVWHQIQGSVFACICEPVSMFVRMMCVYVWPACPCVCVCIRVCVCLCVKGVWGGLVYHSLEPIPGSLRPGATQLLTN